MMNVAGRTIERKRSEDDPATASIGLESRKRLSPTK
jgi:hypothetical protein